MWLQKFLHVGTLNNPFYMRLVKKVQINIIICKDTVVNGNDIEDGRKTSSN